MAQDWHALKLAIKKAASRQLTLAIKKAASRRPSARKVAR